jgi:exodeoxyribonuclease VII, large subunit
MASVYSVTQVNSYIKNMFDQDFALNHIFIKGEISNCKYHSSGHVYFTLKDKKGVLSAVMFAAYTKKLQFKLKEGMEIIVEGSIQVYERDGKYQLYAKDITNVGAGDLYRRFEELRNELEEMGMFAPEYKKPIPKFALKIGVVTASTGAAVRDIINITQRRNPYVQIYLYPALVQGEHAPNSIIAALKALDSMELDVIIFGRGGGSIEDLWAFNNEHVARAVFECETPTISAVGHETDITITDYVADLRAATPSAAAELAVFDYYAFEEHLQDIKMQLKRRTLDIFNFERQKLENIRLRVELYNPYKSIMMKRRELIDASDKMEILIKKSLDKYKHELAIYAQKLEGLSPLSKLGQGYAYVIDEAGKRVDSVNSVNKNDKVLLRFKDGTVNAIAENINKEECSNLM